MQEFEKAGIDKMIGENIIECAQKEWTVPIVLVPNKDGTFQFCIDYCKLNAVVEQNFYPIASMDGSIDSLGEASFSKLDVNSRYLEVEIVDADKDKMELTSHHGL